MLVIPLLTRQTVCVCVCVCVCVGKEGITHLSLSLPDRHSECTDHEVHLTTRHTRLHINLDVCTHSYSQEHM